MTKIDYFFDFQSPYSYLSWRLLERNSLLNQCEWNFRPVPMASVIKAYETKGPAEIESKRDYLMKDILRKCFQNDISIEIPCRLPINTLGVLRMSLPLVAQENSLKLIASFFSAIWEKKLDIEDTQIVEMILKDCGLDFVKMDEAASSKEARKELKSNVDLALRHGVFGVPSFVVHSDKGEELFWGADSLSDLSKSLAKTDDLDEKKYKEYLELFSSQH